MSNQQIEEEFHESVIGKLGKRKVYSSLINNIWDADLANMQLKSKYNKVMSFLFCVIDILVNMHGLFF